MAKIVTANLAQRPLKKNTSVGERRLRDQSGKLSVLRTIDGDSKTLTDDITYVFRQNVAEARRENKRLFGNADRVAKS